MTVKLDMKTRITEILEFGGMPHAIPLSDELSSDELEAIGEALIDMEHAIFHEYYLRPGFREWVTMLVELTQDCSARAALVDRLADYREQNPELCPGGRYMLDRTIGENE